MLAFKMKRPLQEVGLQRMLGSHVDVERWGPAGKELLLKTDGMRERMRDASQNYSDKGAEECREVMGRYQALVYQCAIVCEGVSLRDARLEFKWADAFDSNESASEVDWQYERACVIFNLAASISFLATHQDRATADGLKTACALFQQAAGALKEVQELVRSAPWRGSADLSTDTLGALEVLMLAQAQKCFCEKAESDGMSAAVLCKLTAECAGLYEEIQLRIDEAKSRARPISSMSSEWLDVVRWNAKLFGGMQYYHFARELNTQAKYGEALSALTQATNSTAEAVNACAGANPLLRVQFERAHATCHEAQTKAKKDNDLLYYEKVPPINTLAKPERKRMVRPTPPKELIELEKPTPLPPKAAPAPDATAQLATQLEGTSLGAAQAAVPAADDAAAAGLARLMSMGFDRARAQEALDKCGGSVQAAADLLLGQA